MFYNNISITLHRFITYLFNGLNTYDSNIKFIVFIFHVNIFNLFEVHKTLYSIDIRPLS